MKVETETGWKVTTKNGKSFKGKHTWKTGVWYKVEGDLKICDNGFHCSKTIAEAIGHFAPGRLCKVEAKGENIKENRKECWREMRVVEEHEWTHEMSVKLLVHAARLALPVWGKEFPEDDRPLKAIEAAEKWLQDPTEENRMVTYTVAYAADSAANAAADAAVCAVDASAVAARAAADAAYAVAYVVTDSAAAAVRAAADAAAEGADVAVNAAVAAGYAAAVRAAATACEGIEKQCQEYAESLIK